MNTPNSTRAELLRETARDLLKGSLESTVEPRAYAIFALAVCFLISLPPLAVTGQTKPATLKVELAAPLAPEEDFNALVRSLPPGWIAYSKTSEQIASGIDLPVDCVLLWDRTNEQGNGVLVAFTLRRGEPDALGCRPAIITELYRSRVTSIKQAVKEGQLIIIKKLGKGK